MDGVGAPLRLGWARARLLYHTLAHLGLRTTGQVLAHSWRRSRSGAAEWAARAPAGPALEPGELQETVPTQSGALFRFERAELEVALLADDVARLTWFPGELLPYAAEAPGTWRAPPVSLRPGAAGTSVVAGGSLAVAVTRAGELSVSSQGTVVRQELAPRRRGDWWELRVRPRAGERWSGLGEQAGSVELRPGRYRLWNRDPGGAWGPGCGPLYMGIPVLVCTHGDGALLSFYDNASSCDVVLPGPAGAGAGEPAGAGDGAGPTVAGGPGGEISLRFAGGAARQYLVVGTLAGVVDRYSELTGRPALPPRWALGYHQSRWGYRSQSQVRAVLEGYRAMGLPLSAVHLDIDYMDGYRVFSVDRRRFPDLAGLAAEAMAQGVRLVTIVDPAVKADPRYALYRQGVEQGRFCTSPSGEVDIGVVWPGRAAFPDFTDPGTRRWWAEQYRALADAGAGGVWHDMNEPTSISLAGDPTLALDTRHDVEGRGGDHAQVHNLYGLLMNRAGYDGLRRARPERRPFVLSRSGWAGNQRWAWNWTGDVRTSWAGLRQQVATVVGLGLSGVAFSGSDVGGFSGVPDAELYLRWLQMSVFMGLCRTHSVVGAPAREPWRHPEPARPAVAAWIRLRYRLLPYLYTLAHEAASSGAPLVRPPWWPPGGAGAHPATRTGAGRAAAGGLGHDDADDTFLLGDALLVAAVTAPGTTERRVPLPPGIWRSWWAADDGADRSGETTTAAPLERIPVLVRAGSVVVLDDFWALPSTPFALDGDGELSPGATGAGPVAEHHAPRLFAVHCWPLEGAAGGEAVDDAGDGDGPCRLDRFELAGARAGAAARLHWRRSGGFPAPAQVRVVLHGWRVRSARADGRRVEVRGGSVECAPFEELEMEGLEPA
jgi:alpha-glucosidase